MAVTPGSLIQEGTRVRVRRGTLPVDPALVGRTGVVVYSSEYHPHQYGVTLDGEREVRMFAPVELEVLRGPDLMLEPDREAAKKRRALP